MAANSRDRRRVGLARALSKLGYCSRSQAAKLIRDGRVRLNGTTPRNPETPVRVGADRIDVDDQPVRAERQIYLVLNKPRGIVTTAVDEKGRDTVYAFLPPESGWVGPVGRLDKASEGLLLLTNDSEWGARVSAPETHLDKTYHVQIAGGVDEASLEALTKGIRATNGEMLRAKTARVLRKGERNGWLEITLDEGKNRQIRRMLESRGMQVLRLVRVSVGPLALGTLPKGSCRNLTPEEKQALDAAMKRKNNPR